MEKWIKELKDALQRELNESYENFTRGDEYQLISHIESLESENEKLKTISEAHRHNAEMFEERCERMERVVEAAKVLCDTSGIGIHLITPISILSVALKELEEK